MKKKETIAFLIPTLNEEGGIQKTINCIPRNELNKLGHNTKIYVVDGGSKDKTIELAQKLGASIINSPQRGYGFQYNYAFKKIKGDIVITGDGDGTYPFGIAPELVDILKKNKLDFVTTNRLNRLKQGSMTSSHYIGNKILTITGNVLFNLNLKDNQSGMWCFYLNKVNQLDLTNEDMAFSEEVKIKAFKKLRCKEIDVVYDPRMGISKLRLIHAFKNMIFLFKLKVKN